MTKKHRTFRNRKFVFRNQQEQQTMNDNPQQQAAAALERARKNLEAAIEQSIGPGAPNAMVASMLIIQAMQGVALRHMPPQQAASLFSFCHDSAVAAWSGAEVMRVLQESQKGQVAAEPATGDPEPSQPDESAHTDTSDRVIDTDSKNTLAEAPRPD